MDLDYNAVPMADTPYIGELEQLVLLAILQCGDEAYTVSIRRLLAERSQRRLARDGELARRLAALVSEPVPDEVPGAPGRRARWLTRLQVPVGDRIRLVRVDDIDWLEGAGNYVRVHVGRERHLVRATLAALERLS